MLIAASVSPALSYKGRLKAGSSLPSDGIGLCWGLLVYVSSSGCRAGDGGYVQEFSRWWWLGPVRSKMWEGEGGSWARVLLGPTAEDTMGLGQGAIHPAGNWEGLGPGWERGQSDPQWTLVPTQRPWDPADGGLGKRANSQVRRPWGWTQSGVNASSTAHQLWAQGHVAISAPPVFPIKWTSERMWLFRANIGEVPRYIMSIFDDSFIWTWS